MPDRFFSNIPIDANLVVIDGDQAHHIRNVLRMKIGEEVTLFDGSGTEFSAKLIKLGRREVEFEVLSSTTVCRELDRRIHIASALPKGDRQKTLIEKLVELGVAEFTPINTKRSAVVAYDKTIIRLKKHVVEASKQGGRNRLMSIAPVQKFETFLTRSDSAEKMIAHPYECIAVATCQFDAGGDYVFLVGPEGGFTDEEIVLARSNGWSTIGLGKTILRMETAAIALAVAAGL